MCQCIELFLSKHHFTFLGTSFRALSYLEYMKKIQSLRLEACYCNTDDTKARPSKVDTRARPIRDTSKVLNQDSASN